MKDNEVPQDARDLPEGEKVKKLLYATDEKGNYIGKQSIGWEPENVATGQAWDIVAEVMAQVIADIQSGKASPLAYYLARERMDIALLAKYVGKFVFQVKRHLKPKIFDALSEKQLLRYAKVFNVSIEELKSPLLSQK